MMSKTTTSTSSAWNTPPAMPASMTERSGAAVSI
jgi:hypothetical protein